MRLDYPRLTAILAATQAGGRTGQIESAISHRAAAAASPADGLVTLLDAGPGWIAAARALGGSFNPGVADKAP